MILDYPPPDAWRGEIDNWHAVVGRREDPTERCEGCGHLRTTHRDTRKPNGRLVQKCTALGCGCSDYQEPCR